MSAITSTHEPARQRERRPERVPEPVGKAVLNARTQSTRKQAARNAGRFFRLLPPVLLGVVILVCWYLGTTYGHVNSLLLPALPDVWAKLVDGFSTGIFQSHIQVTIIESLIGFVIAFGIALPLGYALVKSRLLRVTIQPYLAAWQAIPAIAIAPLLILWLGFDLEPVIAICALVVFFPMIISIMLGFQTMEQEYLEAARLDGAAGWSMFSAIELPLALPAIMAAVRTGLTLSITGAIVGEFVRSNDKGLGELALLSKTQYASDMMFATLLVLATLAMLYYVLAWALSRWTERAFG